MKNFISTLILVFLFTAPSISQTADAEGCKDNPMFPKRMPDYILNDCKSNFDAVEFNLTAGGTDMITKEGAKVFNRYDFNAESGKEKPSCLQILRNYENAAKAIGGVTVYQNAAEMIGVYKITKNGQESAWVKVIGGGNDNNDFYEVTTITLEVMKQDVTSDDILKALNTDGHIALYINFETGKADIKPESQNIIDQIAAMLLANPTMKISIEGHTDNVGSLTANQTLSEKRGLAVMNALIAKGIDKSRLSSKGWGQSKAIGDNSTENGKAQNRRVEIVKQ